MILFNGKKKKKIQANENLKFLWASLSHVEVTKRQILLSARAGVFGNQIPIPQQHQKYRGEK